MNMKKKVSVILHYGNDMTLPMVIIFGKHNLKPKMVQRNSKEGPDGTLNVALVISGDMVNK